MTSTTPGLRERKKQETRDRLSSVASALFAERGFDEVTIAEVAAAADVSKMTVTNYFPLKENLVFDQHERIEASLAVAVRERTEQMSILDSLSAAYLAAVEADDPTLGFQGVAFAKMVERSGALRARERQIFDLREANLASGLIEERGVDDVMVRIVAAQLDGVVRVLYYEGRRRLLAGDTERSIKMALRRSSREAFEQLRDGFAPWLTEAGRRPRR